MRVPVIRGVGQQYATLLSSFTHQSDGAVRGEGVGCISWERETPHIDDHRLRLEVRWSRAGSIDHDDLW